MKGRNGPGKETLEFHGSRSAGGIHVPEGSDIRISQAAPRDAGDGQLEED